MSAPKNKDKNKKQAHTCASLNKRIETLETQVAELLQAAKGPITQTPRKENSVQKVESFNGEEIPVPETNAGLGMTHADKMRSMDNAIRILAPTYLDQETNRHTPENIQAICGFPVTQEMHDELYTDIKHEGGFVVPV